MVGFLQFLGFLSILGGIVGTIEAANVGNYGIVGGDPYLLAVTITSGLVGAGIFFSLAEIISNLRKINENLKEGE